jgi:A/G-specific adenine glycosylase
MRRLRLQDKLLAWYALCRRDLPWRRTRDPYAIWLSEVMLQQTRVETVIPYYERFLASYPTVHALAEAPLEDIFLQWSGLGYYRRARMLHSAAEDIVENRGGRFPVNAAELRSLRGVGRYTAGAVASIAWGEPVPVVDGNVARVLSRLFAVDADVRTGAGAKRLWDLAESLVVAKDPSSWNQALMELGATTCLPRSPRCSECPVRVECRARARGLTDKLPRARSKKAPAKVRAVGFVLRRRSRVLLGRRVESGLFGGMWEPPHVADGGRVLLEAAGPRVRRVGSVTHVLSHRRIEMTVHAGPATHAVVAGLRACSQYDDLAWVPVSELGTHALTSLARKVLATAGVLASRGHGDAVQG